MIPRSDPIANPFRKVPNSSIFDILARPRDQTPPPNIQSSRARTDGSPENLRPDCTYRGKPPVSPFINGNRNTNYNNPSLLSNEVFYSSDYSVPFHGLIQHKPISPFRINQKTPPPERPNWKYENKTEPTNRSLSPTPSLPPLSRQEIDKWIKEGGGFSPITHLPKKPLPIIRRDKEYNQPNEPLKEEQMSTGKFGGRLQWNTPQRSKTPTPPQAINNDKQPHTGRVYESVIQERSATPIGNSRRGNEIPKESMSERKGSKVKFSDPEEFSIKPISINKEPTHNKRVNFHFAPQTPITQPNEEQWKKSLASRRPTRQTNSGNEDPKSPITPPVGLSKEGNSQSQPSMIKIKSVTEPSPPRNIKTPQEVKNLPISGYDDYCVNCVNTQMVETRKVKAIQDKSIDREKEKIISTNNIMKKQAEDQAIRDKKSKLVERTRIVQKTLEDEYEKKLEARRNKGEEIPRNLFEGIFERQDQISQRQREIMRKGLRGLQEQADPNRKKSPKEKFWEILDQKQARQFGDAYYNKHLPSPNEVLNSWREQLSYKEEKRRKEKTVRSCMDFGVIFLLG